MIKPEITISMTLPEYLEEVSKSKDELMKEILSLKFQLQDILEQLLKSKLEYTKNLTSFIEQNKMLCILSFLTQSHHKLSYNALLFA